MTTVAITPEIRGRIYGLCVNNDVRVPELTDTTATWTPDLTAAELTTVTDLVAMTRSGVTLSLAEYQSIKGFLATGRSFLALDQAAFIGLSQNARDRMLFDNVSAQWRVIFRLLRDG